MATIDINDRKVSKVLLEGAGGHAKVVIDCLYAMGQQIVRIYDPRYQGSLLGIEVVKSYDPDFESDAGFIVAVGNNKHRAEAVKKITHTFTNAIHASVLVSPHARVGVGSMLLHKAIIQSGASIGDHVILNTGSQVDHDCVIGNFVHVGPGAVLCGGVTIGEGSLVGAGAVVLPGKKIGRWATIGAGAVVAKDVPDYTVVAGVPAEIIKTEDQ